MVKLLIQCYHHVAEHSGLEYTLSLTKQRYWIINGRSFSMSASDKRYEGEVVVPQYHLVEEKF